ncbi:unnamed protein product [Urochloa humidicola]
MADAWRPSTSDVDPVHPAAEPTGEDAARRLAKYDDPLKELEKHKIEYEASSEPAGQEREYPHMGALRHILLISITWQGTEPPALSLRS